MTPAEREARLLQSIDEGLNSITAHPLPDGGMEIMLSHSVTMDNAVIMRVRSEEIAFLFDDPENEERLERTNTGGPWDA